MKTMESKCTTAVLLVCGSVFLACGCQSHAKLKYSDIEPIADRPVESAPVYVAPLDTTHREGSWWGSKGRGEVIGKHTFTIFAIPVMDLSADPTTPIGPTFGEGIHDALSAAGYDPRPADEAPAGARIVKPVLKECFFVGYSWFWPLFVNGGRTRIEVAVVDGSGQVQWSEEYGQYSPGAGVFANVLFEPMVRHGMDRVLQEVRDGVACEEFRQAACPGENDISYHRGSR